MNRKMICVHRLIAESFIDNPDNKKCVNHKDGNKLNNRAENLEWVTYSENSKHAFCTGLGKGHFKKGDIKKLNKEQIKQIQEDNRSSRKIALDYNISHSTVLYYKRNM